VYGETTVDVSAVRRWVRRAAEVDTWGAELLDRPRSGRPYIRTMPERNLRVDKLIAGDRRRAVAWCFILSVNEGCVMAIVEVLSCSKVWVSQMLRCVPKVHGKQSPPIFGTDVALDVRTSCRTLSCGMKPGCTTLNLGVTL
jgi:hypothetical protein